MAHPISSKIQWRMRDMYVLRVASFWRVLYVSTTLYAHASTVILELMTVLPSFKSRFFNSRAGMVQYECESGLYHASPCPPQGGLFIIQSFLLWDLPVPFPRT